MEEKKRVTVLVTIAIILALTAITLNAMDSQEISTTTPATISAGAGEVGVEIQASPVEDKLTEEMPGEQQ